jgi:hypothetical protein
MLAVSIVTTVRRIICRSDRHFLHWQLWVFRDFEVSTPGASVCRIDLSIGKPCHQELVHIQYYRCCRQRVSFCGTILPPTIRHSSHNESVSTMTQPQMSLVTATDYCQLYINRRNAWLESDRIRFLLWTPIGRAVKSVVSCWWSTAVPSIWTCVTACDVP